MTGLDPGSTHQYAVTAFDAAGNESARSTTLQIRNPQPPTAYHPISSSGEVVYAIVGKLFTYDVDAIGVPTPTFSFVAGPAGMTVDSIAGVVEWIPTASDEGTATATVRATNSEGSDDHTFSFPVHPAGTDLVPPSSVWYPAVTNINSNGCTLTWNPATDNIGVAGYYIKARKDGHGNSLFTVSNSVGTGTSYVITTLEPNTGYHIWVAAYDAAGNVATISGVSKVGIAGVVPVFVWIDPTTQTFSISGGTTLTNTLHEYWELGKRIDSFAGTIDAIGHFVGAAHFAGVAFTSLAGSSTNGMFTDGNSAGFDATNGLVPGDTFNAVFTDSTGLFDLVITGTLLTVLPAPTGDFDGDGQVTLTDVQMVAGAWRTANLDYDMDGDELMTIVDIQMVVALWGSR